MLVMFPWKITFCNFREMVFLPDLSDGETSDKTKVFNPDYSELPGQHEEQQHSNSNTLESQTMSARSFGFIKPSQKLRDNDMANRIRRHKSFFNAETSNNNNPGELRRRKLHHSHHAEPLC
jgi:hypothetical protein